MEILANVCVVITCLIVAISILRRPTPQTGRIPRSLAYSVGESLDGTGVEFRTHERTVLLFLTTKCGYCTESLPFYGRLAERLAKSRQARLAVLSPEPEALVKAYLSTHKVPIQEVMQVKAGVFRVDATPTIVIADRAGKVVGTWVGILREREKEVLAAIGL